MNPDEALAELGSLYGILPRFHDLGGVEHATSRESMTALLRANGLDVSGDAAILETLAEVQARRRDRWFPFEIIIESGAAKDLHFGLGAGWTLAEDGGDAAVAEGGPGDSIVLPAVPAGVYRLEARVQGRVEIVRVLAAPAHLPMLDELAGQPRLWGLNVALYGLKSDRNTGLGDFRDLAGLGKSMGQLGAGFIGVNPVHNMGFSDMTSFSPYSPSHRGFLNTAYIALDRIPGLEASKRAKAVLIGSAEPFARIRAQATVAYAAHKVRHQQALEDLFAVFGEAAGEGARADFRRFVDRAPPQLLRFARFEALADHHGPDWRSWPDHDPEQAVTDPARTEFHLWLQWVADGQLQDAQSRALRGGMSLGLYLDLAVGPRRDGAESWCERDSIAEGVSVGAPPDHLNPEGQNWDLAAFSPHRLQARNYAPLRHILAQTMRHAGVVRIDHVLGLNRSFWIPDDGSPGAYIMQPFQSLLAVIKIEAERARTAVIGEDLGLVPEGFRETMRGQGFYGYSVLQYEKDDQGFHDPAVGAEQVLSCFGTHDTPTLKGFEAGRDIDWWQKLGWIDPANADDIRARRRQDVALLEGFGDGRPCGGTGGDDTLLDAVHGALARSPAAMVCVQLDDILGEREAQNLPGTVEQHPNWRRKHAVAVEALGRHPGLLSLARCMARNERSSLPVSQKEETHED